LGGCGVPWIRGKVIAFFLIDRQWRSSAQRTLRSMTVGHGMFPIPEKYPRA
jgi:hypothetical protein